MFSEHILEIIGSAFAAAGGVSVPVILYIASNKREEKRESEKRHAENSRRLDRLATIGEFHKPHTHTEKDGNLTVDGLQIFDGNGALKVKT